MIILITMREYNEASRREEIVVSHGINYSSGRNVILPCETLETFKSQYGARFDEDIGEYVLDNEKPSSSSGNILNDF